VDRALQRDENLMEKRRFPDRVVYGPRGGLAGAVRELVRFDGRGFPLVKADEVSAAVADAGQGRTFVRLEASFVEKRGRAANRTVFGTAAGVATGAVLVAMNVFAPLAVAAGAVVALAGAYLTRRGYRKDVAAAQLAIEQALDRLEFGEPRKRTILDQFLGPTP
jgi:hypothetical protein